MLSFYLYAEGFEAIECAGDGREGIEVLERTQDF